LHFGRRRKQKPISGLVGPNYDPGDILAIDCHTPRFGVRQEIDGLMGRRKLDRLADP
jgi:hypothetical protein